jgi:ubiquinone biosynthesis protein Coq4
MRVANVSDGSHILRAMKNDLTTLYLKARSLRAFVNLVRDPSRLDEVFEMADALSKGYPELPRRMARAFRQTERGAAAFRDRPRVGRLVLAELATMPAGTLGREFHEHMRKNGLDPAALPQLEVVDEVSFMRAHLYETHDLWHTITGFDADVAGELGLQAFYTAQMDGRLGLLILSLGMLNTTISGYDDRYARLDAIGRGWEMGKRAELLFGLRWRELLGEPIDEVRRRLNIDLSPTRPASRPAERPWAQASAVA